MTIDIVKQLKQENRMLKEKVKQLEDQWEQSLEYRDTDYEMFKMEEEAEKYYKEKEKKDVVWDMTDIDKDWDQIFQS